MSGSGRGGNNRRGSRRREHERDNWSRDNTAGNKKRGNNPRFDRNRGGIVDRPKWTPPQVSTESIPVPNCPYCGEPIKDLAAAIADKDSGRAVHFECIIGRLAENETLERGDSIVYIGGGRFGIVHFNTSRENSGFREERRGGSGPGRTENQTFTIKKIFEWEDKDERADWRKLLADHFSVT
jgi:hypothetical protein